MRRAYQGSRLSIASPSTGAALRIPAVPFEESGFDAFDRMVARFPAVGGLYFTTFHALSRDECDPLDHDSSSPHYRTCTTMRMDGHGRVVDQILRNRQPGIATTEYYRLFTDYRADNAVTHLTRAETTSDTTRESVTVVGNHTVERTFTYDTAGRRIGTTDPDSDSRSPARTAQNRTWRYLFNRVGDLVAVRDPRGCGQDFFYDHAARLVAEDYIRCAESSAVNEVSDLALPFDAIGLELVTAGRSIDVHYLFDEAPGFALGQPEVTASAYRGRLGGVEDRGQRSAMAYDDRGQVVWTVRQMTVIPDAALPTVVDGADGLPVITEGPALPWTRTFDEAHGYERTATYDHGGRPIAMTLPLDPDYEGGPAPVVGGALEYNARGLPRSVDLTIDGAARPIVAALVYTRDGLVEEVTYGDNAGPDGSRSPTVSFTRYDDRRRPVRMTTTRTPNAHGELADDRPLADVATPHDQMLVWDLADNLIAIEDLRDPTEWPDGYRPQSVHVVHDSLYRVAGAEYEYTADDGSRVAADLGTDYRTELAATRSNDPMRTRPAPMATTPPDDRMVSMTWEYDWLGNMQEWTDDASAFYERSLGDIVNGADETPSAERRRPGALYIASNLPATPTSALDQGGWVEVRYGEDGNVLAMTVHAQCAPTSVNGLPLSCREGVPGPDGEPEAVALSCTWACASEQHYRYAWDEVNRIAEARRFDRDRTAGAASWELAVQQRYLYDSANQRTVKTTTFRDEEVSTSRTALYVYPGDFERRGLTTGFGQDGAEYQAIPGDTETQYVVGGARIIWRTPTIDGMGLDRDHRITIACTDLIQSTTAVIDLATGEMVETGTYYANGARETYRANENGDRVAAEPMGFTGKEADEEVGLTYFGQRYLMSHLGRWASPDPLQTHAVGGGEALNGYHYVAGNVLQARDPAGLTIAVMVYEGVVSGTSRGDLPTGHHVRSPSEMRDAQRLVDAMRTFVRAEASARIEAERAALLARETETGVPQDWGAMEARETSLRARAEAEAAAISLNTTTGTIDVTDVYAATRSGASRGELGTSVYERLLVLANDPREAQVGFATSTMPPQYRGGTIESREPGVLSWTFVQPTEALSSVHELIIHAYRMANGMDSSHHGYPHTQGGPSAWDSDNEVDDEAHYLWDFSPDSRGAPEEHRHWPDIPHRYSPNSEGLPYLPGPTLDTDRAASSAAERSD